MTVKKKTSTKEELTKENLMTLGSEYLADILLDLSIDNKVIQRALKVALAGNDNVDKIVKEVRKRLMTIDKSRSVLEESVKVKELLLDLQTQRKLILRHVSPNNPSEALDLLWKLSRLFHNIIDRCYYDASYYNEFFVEVSQDIGEMAVKIKEDPKILAERIYEDALENLCANTPVFILHLKGALGEGGLNLLKEKFLACLRDKKLQTRYLSSFMAEVLLRYIADLQDDVDAYIQMLEERNLSPEAVAEIAKRLLKAGRIDEAWHYIEKVKPAKNAISKKWVLTRIDIFKAQGKQEEVQKFRYQIFEDCFWADMLKDYLAELPEFEVFDAEKKALTYVINDNHIMASLAFLCEWNAPHYLNEMIEKRYKELDGENYEILPIAAKLLAQSHYLSASLILRSMIDFTLDNARTSRYKYAIKHFKECIALSKLIKDYKGCLSHEEYTAKIKKEHGRKYGFWGGIKI